MPDVRYNGDGPEKRISDRLRSSGDSANADHVVQKGSGPTRTFTNIHHGGMAKQSGSDHPGEGDINGNKRGVI